METSRDSNSNNTAEIEAKFLIRQQEQFGDVLATLMRLGYRVSDRGTVRHVDRYFDTSDWRILRAGWAFRRRRSQTGDKLALKSMGRRDGPVFFRDEIEQPLSDASSITKGPLPYGPVQQLLVGLSSDRPLRRLFDVKCKRAAFDVSTPGDSAAHVELDFDRTRIKARKARKNAAGSLQFMELEFETDSADAAAALVDILCEHHGLIPSRLSKFERGMQACGLSPGAEGDKPPNESPKPKQPILDLVYFYLDSQLRELRNQWPRAWEGLDPEGVHGMRVAIRRARTVLKEFRAELPTTERDHLDTELKWLLKELGHVRDADVCEAAIEHYRAGLHGDSVDLLEPFETHLRQTTIGAHAELVEVLGSDRYVSLVEEFERFVHARIRESRDESLSQMSIAECEDELVHKVVDKMHERAAKVSQRSPAKELHRLRLLAKRLRYLLEFFSVARPKRWRKPVRALRKMQDELGEHQDAVVARQRLTDFAESVPLVESNRGLLLAMGRLTQQEEDRAIACRRKFPKSWRRFERSITPLL